MQNGRMKTGFNSYTGGINFTEYVYKKQILTSFILSIVALSACIVLAVVFPLYFNSQFHFNNEYSSLIRQSNKALTNTGVIQGYLDYCQNRKTSTSETNYLQEWCDNILDNIEPNILAYQTTTKQQKLQLLNILANEKDLLENTFFCDNVNSEDTSENKYCVCNYYSVDDGVQTYTNSNGVQIKDSLKYFCRQGIKRATIYNEKLVEQINNFVE